MISYRQADLMETLNQSKERVLLIHLRYENYKLEVTSISPLDDNWDMAADEKISYLENAMRAATSTMGFYRSTKDQNLWTYNVSSNKSAIEAVMSVRRRLVGYGDPRIVKVRDSISENIAKDRFTIEVTVK